MLTKTITRVDEYSRICNTAARLGNYEGLRFEGISDNDDGIEM